MSWDELSGEDTFSPFLEHFQRKAGHSTSYGCLWGDNRNQVTLSIPSKLCVMTLSMTKGTCIITISVAKYKHTVVKKCCYDGAFLNDDENCEKRAARIQIGPNCVRAFKECCNIAKQHRDEESHKKIQLGRLRKFDISYHNSAQYEEFCVNFRLLKWWFSCSISNCK